MRRGGLSADELRADEPEAGNGAHGRADDREGGDELPHAAENLWAPAPEREDRRPHLSWANLLIFWANKCLPPRFDPTVPRGRMTPPSVLA